MTAVQFDIHVMVDWSASAAPTRGRDSIWTAVRDTRSDRDDVELSNHATRAAALEHLDHVVRRSVGRRVLIGVDFSLGYPAGTVSNLVPEQPTWRGVWSLLTELVTDDAQNRNNRFEVGAQLNRQLNRRLNRRLNCQLNRQMNRSVDRPPNRSEGPFWGRPSHLDIDGLSPTRPVDQSWPQHRQVERALRSAGHRPFSVWQLCYAGSVGGQTLTGIPVMERLRRAHPHRVRVWPFETGLVASGAEECDDVVVVAEIWPSAFDVDLGRHPVRDAAQVLHVAATTVDAQQRGELGAWFAPTVAHADRVAGDEGWILGVDGDGSVMWRP